MLHLKLSNSKKLEHCVFLLFCDRFRCREFIRNHLLELDTRKHLFWRVPKLRLPIFLTKNLLFGMSLDMKREYPDIGAHNYEYDDDDDYSDGDEYTDDSEYSEEYTESDDDDHHVETLNEKLETVTIVPPEVTNNEC